MAVTLRTLGRNRRYAGTVVGYAAYTFAIGGLAVWMPTFLERVRGRELASADFFVGAVTAVAGLGGTFIGGYLGDRLTARLRDGHVWLSGVSDPGGGRAGVAGADQPLALRLSDQFLRRGSCCCFSAPVRSTW